MLGIFNAVFRTAARTNPHKFHHSSEMREMREEQRRRQLEEDLTYQLRRPRL